MKYLILILMFLVLATPVFAATPTPIKSGQTPSSISPTISSSQKNENLVEQINQLKDKIASRVAQLKLVDRRGVIGTVTDVSESHITLTNLEGNIQLIDVDEITKFSSSTEKGTFGISDVKNGMVISVMGLYNKESKHILARFISTFTLPTFLSGSVTDMNKTDFTITVAGKDNKNTIIDIETTTKINSYTDGKIVRSGFTKIVTGDRVEIVGYPSKNDKTRLTGSYILQLNDLSSSTSPSPIPSK